MRCGYSGVEHLAKTVLLNAWSGSVWLFMVPVELSAAYFDESRTNEEFPVVAGFWNPINVWMHCESHLQRALREKPANLSAKKYVRDNPSLFAKILTVFELRPIFATLERKSFEPLFAAQGDGRVLFSNAYSSCAYMCCELLDWHAIQSNMRTPIKVVFDDGTEAKHKIALERGYRKYYADKPDSRLSKVPLFEDDEQTLPLLAADLYAWLLSRKYNFVLTPEEADALSYLDKPYALHIELDEDHVRQIQEK
jgi:hypothetical protein